MTATKKIENLINRYATFGNEMILRSEKFAPLWIITGLLIAAYVALVLTEAARRKALDIEL